LTHRTGVLPRRVWWWVIGAVIVLVAASLIISEESSSKTSASAPGVTPTSITLGSHQVLTGPAAPGYRTVAVAANAFFKYVNAHGGVYGRSINFDYQDDSYNPVNTLSVVRKLVEQDNVFAVVGGLGTPTHQSVVSYLNDRGVPDLFVESGCTCFNSPGNLPDTFGYFPDYKIEGKILAQYVVQNYPQQKVGYLYQDDDLGQDSQSGANQIITSNLVASRQSYDPNYLDNGLVPQIAAEQAAGAQVIILFGINAATALALIAAASMHYHPTFVVANIGSDPNTVGGLITQFSKGALPASIENGLVTDYYLPQADNTADQWIQLFKRVHDTYEATDPFDDNTINGMAMAYGVYQALHAAGPNLTRQGLLAALTTQGATFAGPNLGPYGFSPTNHNGMQGLQMGIVNNGQLATSGPVYTTDDHDAPVTTYNGAHPPPPTSF
jgi:branched-chain amino acid transport system substrate-binding protein